MPNQKSTDAALAAGRLAYERHAWGEAYDSLTAADAAGDLDPEDLERLAITAFMLGRPDAFSAAATRAHVEAVRTGDVGLAIRSAYGMGMESIQRGEMAQGGGWLARGARLVEETGYDGVEPGFLLIPQALQALMGGRPADAFAIFEQVAAIAERFDDADLRTMGRLGRGQSLIAMVETRRGVALLDEAMTAVISGEVSPIASGIVYCAVIEACQSMFDLRRAQEWTGALERWWQSQPDMVPFRGNCLVFRAELMRFHGAWGEATDEAERAREWLSRPPPEPAVGEAIYQLAELDRLRGAFEAAEAGYREAGAWGRLPEPGLALLQLAQGDISAAPRSIRRAMAEATDDMVRARMLEPAAEIALAAGDVGAARDAADRLSEIAGGLDAPLARVRWPPGPTAPCGWRKATSRVRWRYSGGRGRRGGSSMPRTKPRVCGPGPRRPAARSATSTVPPSRPRQPAKCSNGSVRPRISPALEAGTDAAALPGGLSAREVEVLRLVAAGLTNRAIADALTISERTVDRHVSNIFTKLDVSTRAAATAFAYEHGLV